MRRFLTLTLLLSCATTSSAQLVSVDVNDENAWTIVQDVDAVATFGFDYGSFGIPAAPGSDDTLGLRLEANLVEPAASAAISVSPNELSLAGKFRVEVDVWMNYYVEPNAVGTTEFGGLFVGFDQAGDPINGSGLLASGDGGATEDYRLFGDGVFFNLDTEQYSVPSLNNTDPVFTDEWPGQEVPDAQLDFDPPNEFAVALDGSLAFAWHTLIADVDTLAGEAVFFIDDIEIGIVIPDINGGAVAGNVALTMADLFSSIAPVPDFAFTVFDNFRVAIVDGVLPGDLNSDGQVNVQDIDLLTAEIIAGGMNVQFDVNGDSVVDFDDQAFLVHDILDIWFGDANVDGEFNSGDFVGTFTQGKYESGLSATWGEGDWNADGKFDSSDFVAAFSDGGYENGPRPAVAAVPEPASSTLLAFAGLLLLTARRRQN